MCGQILPWNYPIPMFVWKISPALAAGKSLQESILMVYLLLWLFNLTESVSIPRLHRCGEAGRADSSDSPSSRRFGEGGRLPSWSCQRGQRIRPYCWQCSHPPPRCRQSGFYWFNRGSIKSYKLHRPKTYQENEVIRYLVTFQVGRIIMQAAPAVNLKRVTLELGGKSPLVIFNDADGNTLRLL